MVNNTSSGLKSFLTLVTLVPDQDVVSSQHDLPEAEEEGEGGSQEGSHEDGGQADINHIRKMNISNRDDMGHLIVHLKKDANWLSIRRKSK